MTNFIAVDGGGGAEQDCIGEFFGHLCPRCEDWAEKENSYVTGVARERIAFSGALQ